MILVYFDNNATTRLLPEAFEAMRPYLTERFLNPASAAARILGETDPAIEAKRALGQLLGDADLYREIVITSGASEANSWAIQAGCPIGGHLITTRIEHPSLLAAAGAAERRGVRVDYVSPGSDGRVRPDDILELLTPDTALISIMLANNETGVLQPIEEIAAAVRKRSPHTLLHTDATQAVGRIAIDLVDRLGDVDLLSLSAHKFHGPRGIGAWFVRDGVEVSPLIYGAQEDGRRGGTANSASAAGMATAARHAFERLDDMDRVESLRSRIESELLEIVPGARVNGVDAPRLPNTSSITFPGILADEVVDQLALQGICIASGSACESGSTAPSHVLTALGLSYEAAKATVRFSLSFDTTADEVSTVIAAMRAVR